MSDEEWRPVENFHGFYEISSHGRVRSVARTVYRRTWRGNDGHAVRKSVVLSPHLACGYPRVLLSKEGIKTKALLHHLVCEAFHGKRPDGKQVAHINGKRDDNRPENLMWATPKENMAHQYIHKTRKLGTDHHKAKLNPQAVVDIRDEFAKGISRRALYSRYKISRSSLYAVLTRKSWAHVR